MSNIYEQFADELASRQYSPTTIPHYVGRIKDLVAFYQRFPGEITREELIAYISHVIQTRKYTRKTFVGINSALRAFHRYVLKRSESEIRHLLPRLQTSSVIPNVYSPSEVERLLSATTMPKYSAIFMVMYGCGLHIEEVCNLRVEDLRKDEMRIFIKETDRLAGRFVFLSHELRERLRGYWRLFRPYSWLFPSGRDPSKRMDETNIHRVFPEVAARAGLKNYEGVHSLRDTFAVHAFKNGVGLSKLQYLLGHRWSISTSIYAYALSHWAGGTRSALNLIPIEEMQREEDLLDIEPAHTAL